MSKNLPNKKNKPQVIYNTVFHRARKRLGLDLLDFCVADTVYHLANNPASITPGWSYQDKATIADNLGVSERAVYNSLNRLVKFGLLERGGEKPSRLLRTTTKWYFEVMVDKSTLEDSQSSAECADRLQEVQSMSAECAVQGLQNVQTQYKNYINNNINDNISSIYQDRVKSFFQNPDPIWLVEIKKTFPKANLSQELQLMRTWLISNPDRPKKNLKRFVMNWLNNAKPGQSKTSSAGHDLTVTEDFLNEQLGKIATRAMIKNVMRSIPEQYWPKISDFLRRRYPGSPNSFEEVRRELVQEILESRQKLSNLTKSIGRGSR